MNFIELLNIYIWPNSLFLKITFFFSGSMLCLRKAPIFEDFCYISQVLVLHFLFRNSEKNVCCWIYIWSVSLLDSIWENHLLSQFWYLPNPIAIQIYHHTLLCVLNYILSSKGQCLPWMKLISKQLPHQEFC